MHFILCVTYSPDILGFYLLWFRYSLEFRLPKTYFKVHKKGPVLSISFLSSSIHKSNRNYIRNCRKGKKEIKRVDFYLYSKLYIPSTLNIDLILWHTQLIVCAENVKSWIFDFTYFSSLYPNPYIELYECWPI